ncbi:hypothetical protein CWI38_0497p0030 [Hamiltosporidium tvaerminnensis]|uniref:Uncharacterized protein n=1 Tax=Hamiltosporidium tvaerminnensis TaxID=1176355 RepID=A0A4Q9LXW6_9MICR|nr:hypothetical protein CWI38_0497p0030 [Hamiltosporidium tvaerminnensis]
MSPKKERRIPRDIVSYRHLNIYDLFLKILADICLAVIEIFIPMYLYKIIYGLRAIDSNKIIFKYFILLLLFNCSFVFTLYSKSFESKHDLYYMIIFSFGFFSILAELFIHNLNITIIYELVWPFALLYVIFCFGNYFSICIKFNSCKFIRKEIPIITFIGYFYYLFIFILIDSFIYKFFLINIKILFVLKSIAYGIGMILCYVYLIRKNKFKVTLLLLLYHFTFLCAMEMNTLHYLYLYYNPLTDNN